MMKQLYLQTSLLFLLLTLFSSELSAPNARPAGPADSQLSAKSGDTDRFLLSKGKAGRTEVGMSIDALYAKFDRKQMKLVNRDLEGLFSPALEIYLGGREKINPSIITDIGWRKGWVVDRIIVYDSRFKTEKGVGIGSTLGSIRRLYKIDWIDQGEDAVYCRVEDLGISFALDIKQVPRQWYTTKDQKLIPDTAKVLWVLITSG